MYSLINKDITLSRGTKVNPHVSRLVAQHKTNVEKQIAWYKENYQEVNGRNPLVRLAYGILSYRQDNAMLAYQTAKTFMQELISPIGFTSDVHEGKVHYEFFGETPTAILALDRSNPAEVFVSSNNYQTLRPVKVVHVPSAKDNLLRPDLAEHETGFGLITVDVPLFAMGLAQWMKQNMKKDPDKREGVEQFIGRWVLPNAMYGQADNYPLAVLEAKTFEACESSSKQMLPDVGKDFFKYLNEFKDELNAANTIEDVLKTLPAVFKKTQFDAILFPRGYVPKQSHWARSSAFLRPLKIAMEIATDNQDGRALKNKFKREQRRMDQEKTYDSLDDTLMSTELSLYRLDIQFMFEAM
ncbi:hypothetical protein CZP2022_203 [Vibrio phage C-ZP2022]|nr:hypothetical protein CZP2022_203 [Vibrio phage C-ZP2022]